MQFAGVDAQNVFRAAREQTHDEQAAADLRQRWARADVTQIADFAVEARRLRGILGPNDDLAHVIADLMQLEGLMEQWRRVERRLEGYFADALRHIPEQLKNHEDVTWETILAGARRTGLLTEFQDHVEQLTAHIWKLRLRKFVSDFLDRACGHREGIETALKQKFRFDDPDMPHLPSGTIIEMLRHGDSVPGALRLAAQRGNVEVTAGFHMSPTDKLPHCTVRIVDAQGKTVGHQWHVYVRRLPKGWVVHSCGTI